MSAFKPMLASDAETSRLRFPVMTSPKLDGVRATVINGQLMTRSGKMVPNQQAHAMFGHMEHCDGELIMGPPNSPSVYRDTMSGVMSREKDIPDLQFFVFDYVKEPTRPWRDRIQQAAEKHVVLTHTLVSSPDELADVEARTVGEGYEGVMLRDPNASYKHGRSTVAEGGLLKLKRFTDCEAVVVGVVERMHNANDPFKDELGYTTRSSHQANMVPMGMLGALIVRRLSDGVEFNVGTGFTDYERQTWWDKVLTGRICKVKYFNIGVKDKPRHPVFAGWRAVEDMA